MTMSSNEPVHQWERRWSEAKLVRRVAADAASAQRRLGLAEINVGRAKREQAAGDADAALIFAEQALINAADAVLTRDGFSASSHVVRFSYPLLPATYRTERGLIDQIRSARNTAQYEASGGVSASFAARAIALAELAVGEVRAALR
jgi:hypothetical protein